MEKTFTLNDLQYYLREAGDNKPCKPAKKNHNNGPSELVIHNILSYSKALNVMSTRSAGAICQLVN